MSNSISINRKWCVSPRIFFAILFLVSPFLFSGCDDTEEPESAEPVAQKKSEAKKSFSIRAPELGATYTFTTPSLYKHISFLTSDACNGRLTGTPGCQRARNYIVEQFKKWNLQPGSTNLAGKKSFLNSFPFTSGIKRGGKSLLGAWIPKPNDLKDSQRTFIGQLQKATSELPPKMKIGLGYQLDTDFRPLRLSGFLKRSKASLVFVGYGISDEKVKYDDYAGLDVKGKIVLAFRGEPETEKGLRIGMSKPNPHAHPSVYSDIFYKASTARDKGALALILVTGYRNTTPKARAEFLPFLNGGRMGSRLPVVQVLPKAAADWFQHTGKDLKTRQQEIDGSLTPKSFALEKVELTLGVDVKRARGTSENVVAVLPGHDPNLKDEIIVIGAHYDHLGLGNEFSLADKNELGKKIHRGADDNASGIASLLELAKAFSTHPKKLKRTLYFVAFSGEELGTLGSLYLTTRPPKGFDLKKVVAMLNLDMVGRCSENKLMITGTGTAKEFAQVIEQVNKETNLIIRPTPDGFGGSDQLSFLHQKVPVLFFFTGSHIDYHKPSDTIEKLNLPDQAKITAMVYAIAARLNHAAQRPQYIKVDPPKKRVTGMGGVRMGTLPDYAYDGKGLRITGVRSKSPADKAGMKGGDIIIKFAGKNIEDIYDFMNALKLCKPDVEIEVVVKRKSKEVTLKASPEKR